MVSWSRLQDQDRAGWDAVLSCATDANPFQAYAWGEYKRRQGWLPERWLARDKTGRLAAGLQALRKRLPWSRTAVWAPGGPLLGFADVKTKETASLLQSWLAASQRDDRLCYARFRCHLRADPAWTGAFGQACSRPAFKIDSGLSLAFDLTQPLAKLRAAMSSKHRYYVKRSEQAGIDWDFGNDAPLRRDMGRLYSEMLQTKAFAGRSFTPETACELGEAFQEDAVFLIGKQGGEPITGCLALQTGACAFYLMAATGAAGRKLSASYAMVAKLFEILQSRGAARFDFGGIAPATAEAAGVDHFKRGFGGEPREYVGEWDWARPFWLRQAVSAALRLRGKAL